MMTIEKLHKAAMELRAGRVTSTKLPVLKQTISVLQDIVDKNETLCAARLEISENGSVELVREFTPELMIEFGAEGVSLEAGERISTALKRYRTAHGLTVEEMVQGLPISADMYRTLERGGDINLAEDILSALATRLEMSVDSVRTMYQRDIDYPVCAVNVAYPNSNVTRY